MFHTLADTLLYRAVISGTRGIRGGGGGLFVGGGATLFPGGWGGTLGRGGRGHSVKIWGGGDRSNGGNTSVMTLAHGGRPPVLHGGGGLKLCPHGKKLGGNGL